MTIPTLRDAPKRYETCTCGCATSAQEDVRALRAELAALRASQDETATAAPADAVSLVADFYRWTQQEGSHGTDCPYGRPLGDRPGCTSVKERKEKGCTCGLWGLEKRAHRLLDGDGGAPARPQGDPDHERKP